jgi:tRNA-splicing ligase RtcB
MAVRAAEALAVELDGSNHSRSSLHGERTLLARWDTYIDCAHNYVRREEHFGEYFWVHRKGALSAMAGETGVIPGSMGSESYHVEGRAHAAALLSSSHGAGRAMSRAAARHRITLARLEHELRGIWFDRSRASALRDEAPSAYKPIAQVMRAQRQLTKIVRIMRPVLSYKGV